MVLHGESTLTCNDIIQAMIELFHIVAILHAASLTSFSPTESFKSSFHVHFYPPTTSSSIALSYSSARSTSHTSHHTHISSHLLIIAVRHSLLSIMRATRRATEGLELPACAITDLDPIARGIAAVCLPVANACGRGDGDGGQDGDGEEGEEFGEHVLMIVG